MTNVLNVLGKLIHQSKKTKNINNILCSTNNTNTNTNTNNNNNNTTTTTTNVVVINNFGQEDVIVPDELLQRCLEDPKNGIQMLVKYIHFNDDFPQNKNIRCGSKTRKSVQIMDIVWKDIDSNTVFNILMKKQSRQIFAYKTRVKDKEYCDAFDRWYYPISVQTGPNFYTIRRELFCMASNCKREY
jgi:hypothetical protein